MEISGFPSVGNVSHGRVALVPLKLVPPGSFDDRNLPYRCYVNMWINADTLRNFPFILTASCFIYIMKSIHFEMTHILGILNAGM